MVNWEIKKIFKSKNGMIVISLFLILLMSMVFIKPKSKLIDSEGNERKINIREEYESNLEELKIASQSEGKDEFSVDIKEIANDKLNAMESEKYKDTRFWRVFNYRSSHPFMILIMIIIIAVLFSNIYTDEIISGVDSLILSSKNRYKVLYSKLVISIGTPIVLYAGYLIAQFITTYIQYGRPINGSLQAVRIVDIPLLLNGAYTIYKFILLKIGILSIVLISLSVLASLISFISKNSIQSISGFLMFIFLGKIVTLIKGLPKSIMMVISRINYIDLLFKFNEFALMYSGKVKLFSINLDITNLSLSILIVFCLIEIFICRIIFKKLITR